MKFKKNLENHVAGKFFVLGAIMSATVSSMNLRKKFHRLTYICSIWSQQKLFDHTPPLLQNAIFWRPKTWFEAVLSCKVLLKKHFIRPFSTPKVVKGVSAKLFAISSSSTFENGDVGEAHSQRELPIWDVEKSLFNIMRNGNNPLVQRRIDNIFGFLRL